MAHLDDRIRAALAPDARLEDCRNVLADAEAAKAATDQAKAEAEERRVDPDVTVDQAAEAQLDLEEATLQILRLSRAIDKLRELIKAKERRALEDGRRRAYDAAKRRRDQLAADLAERGPALLAELVELIKRIAASDAELELANQGRKGGEWLASAEAVARDCNPHFWNRNSKLPRLLDMRIPAFDATGETIWPDEAGDRARLAERQRLSIRTARRQVRQHAEQEAARWGWFDLAPPRGQDVMITVNGRHRETGLYRERRTVELDAAEADRLRGLGVAVSPALIATYRVSDGGDRSAGMVGRTLATADGEVRIGRESGEHRMTETQAAAAVEAGFILEPLPSAAEAGAAPKLNGNGKAAVPLTPEANIRTPRAGQSAPQEAAHG